MANFYLIFVASCICSSFAFLSIFKQNIHKENSLWTNLSANAFGIYLLHYIYITWSQFALLNVSLPVIIKFSLVFLFTITASWAIVNFARKLKVVNQII